MNHASKFVGSDAGRDGEDENGEATSLRLFGVGKITEPLRSQLQIGMALRAFLRLEIHCYQKGISWFEAKSAIIREAVRVYLAKPLYTLNSTT